MYGSKPLGREAEEVRWESERWSEEAACGGGQRARRGTPEHAAQWPRDGSSGCKRARHARSGQTSASTSTASSTRTADQDDPSCAAHDAGPDLG